VHETTECALQFQRVRDDGTHHVLRRTARVSSNIYPHSCSRCRVPRPLRNCRPSGKACHSALHVHNTRSLTCLATAAALQTSCQALEHELWLHNAWSSQHWSSIAAPHRAVEHEHMAIVSTGFDVSATQRFPHSRRQCTVTGSGREGSAMLHRPPTTACCMIGQAGHRIVRQAMHASHLRFFAWSAGKLTPHRTPAQKHLMLRVPPPS
jgi:hypothetical protein